MNKRTYIILLALAALIICSKTQPVEPVRDDPPIPTCPIMTNECPIPPTMEPTPLPCPIIEYARQTSRQGKEFIAFWEDFRNAAYNDLLGNCTVGYGHLLRNAPCQGNEWPSWVTKDQGWILLEDDVSRGDFFIYQQGWSLNQQQWDAISSIIYNMGIPNFEKSKIYAAINDGRLEEVPTLIRSATCCASVLVRRRADEARIWEEGVYSHIT